MDLLENRLLRQALAPRPKDRHAEPRKRLLDALLQMRERAKMLANEIHRDLPDFTVHDITHLDALWEMADLIAGPDYPLNPLEAFALGAVFLLHDLGLGLAAYPGGLAELKQGPGWQDALATYLRKHLERIPTAEELASPPSEIERMAIQERLRVLHAEQAERLALASWRHGGGPEYHLIDDPDLRLAIGPLLGKIAHSHWWPVSRLSNEFGTVRGALTNCPRDWTLDPLKIAVLLRTADAAHLDGRRAPGFLLALRRPEGFSEDHWRFQNHLLKPWVEGGRLVYTTARPFSAEEADAWWLCEEALRMVDRELRQADSLLSDQRRSRLYTRSVAGSESPDRLLKFIEVSGWIPVDARLHVSNVVDLVKKMGGANLYGDYPYIPLRELIQNASDAVRARRVLQNLPDNWGRITVRAGRDDQGLWVEVEDTGIGMSEAVLVGPLLDFGATYWGSPLMREEHEGLWAKEFEPVGRFGIGFFSIFMWGEHVRITTRQYKKESQKNSRVLEFRLGLRVRPLLRLARPEEQLLEGGTRVRVWLSQRSGDHLFSPSPSYPEWSKEDSVEILDNLCSWLAPTLDVDLFVGGERNESLAVAASDWITISRDSLLSRLYPKFDLSSEPIRRMSYVEDSEGLVLGRGILPVNSKVESGIVTVGGLRAGLLPGFLGVLLGSTDRVTRNQSKLLASDSSMAEWASAQAIVAEELGRSLPGSYALQVLMFGGSPGNIRFIRRGEEWVGLIDLACWNEAPREVIFGTFIVGVSLPDDVLGIFYSELTRVKDAIDRVIGVIANSLAKACGCYPEIVRVDSSFKSEIFKQLWFSPLVALRMPKPE